MSDIFCKIKKINIYIYFLIILFTSASVKADIKKEIALSYLAVTNCTEFGKCKEIDKDYEILSTIIIAFDKNPCDKYLSKVLSAVKKINKDASLTILKYVVSKLKAKSVVASKDLMIEIVEMFDVKKATSLDLKDLLSILEFELFYGNEKFSEIVKKVFLKYNFQSNHERAKFFVKYSKFLSPDVFDEKIISFLLAGEIKAAEMINNLLQDGGSVKERNNVRIGIAKYCVDIKKRTTKEIDDLYKIESGDDGVNILLAKCMIYASRSEDSLKFLSKVSQQEDTEIGEAMFRSQNLAIVNLIVNKKYKYALDVLSLSKPKSKQNVVVHSWYLGWINLEFLSNPKEAIKHFQSILDNSSYAISQSRGNYWLGRAYEKIGDFDRSGKFYQKASEFSATFYGQAAIKKLGKSLKSELKNYTNDEVLGRENKNLLFKTGVLLNKYGLEELSILLIQDSFLNISKDERFNTLFNASLVLKKYDFLPISRYVGRFGVVIPEISYQKIHKNTSNLVAAITRQESGFSVGAISNKGAMGLMQVIPETAMIISKQLGMSYSSKRMLEDKEYNIKIGTEYIRQMLATFNNSAVMAIGAYNAGPAPIKRWRDIFGDPRFMSDEEVINWIESTTYSQTRDYMMRVLENYAVYSSFY